MAEEPQWSAREGIERIFELQGHPVKLLKPLEENSHEVAHVHYGQYWYTGDEEPASLRKQVLSICGQFTKEEALINVTKLYSNYFAGLGLSGSYHLDSGGYLPASLFGFSCFPPPDWQTGQMIQVFPMIDFKVNLEITRKSLEKRGAQNFGWLGPLNTLNSTRVKGDVYEVFTPNGEALQRWLNNSKGIDAFEMSGRSQKLISALLREKV